MIKQPQHMVELQHIEGCFGGVCRPVENIYLQNITYSIP